MRYPVRYSLRNRLSSGRAKVGDLLEHREEKRQLIPYPELSSEWTHGYNSVVMSNDDILLVFGIYNDPMGNSCPQMPSIFLWGLKTHCLPPPQTVSNFCVESQKISKNFKKWASSFTSWMFYHLQKFIYEAKLSQIYFWKANVIRHLSKTDEVNEQVFPTHSKKDSILPGGILLLSRGSELV